MNEQFISNFIFIIIIILLLFLLVKFKLSECKKRELEENALKEV